MCFLPTFSAERNSGNHVTIHVTIIPTVPNIDFSLIVFLWMKYNWMKCQNKWTTSPDKMQ